MKKILSLVMITVLVSSMFGCSKKAELFELGALNGAVELVSSDTKYTGKLDFDGHNKLSFIIDQPSELSGMELLLYDGKLCIKHTDINVETDYKADESPFNELLYAVKLLSENSAEIHDEGICEVNMQDDGRKFVYKIDCDSKRLTEISNDKITARFVY